MVDNAWACWVVKRTIMILGCEQQTSFSGIVKWLNHYHKEWLVENYYE